MYVDIHSNSFELIDNIENFLSMTANSYEFTNKKNDNEIIITGQVPGYSKKDIDIEVKDKNLIISGKAKALKSFKRVYKLSDLTDADNITALCRNGLLTIIIPRIIPDVFQKTITVK